MRFYQLRRGMIPISFLYKEGAFWKAYQQSAYLLLKHCNVDYIVKYKYVKYEL